MSKTYKNGLLKKKILTKVQKSVFMKKSVQKSVQVGTLVTDDLTMGGIERITYQMIQLFIGGGRNF